jgi:hypothetical protein
MASTIVVSAVVIVVLAIATYVIISIVKSGSNLQDLAKNPVSLNTSTTLMDSSTAQNIILSGAGSSLCAFVNVQLGDRTVRVDDSNFKMLFGMLGSVEFQVAPAPQSSPLADKCTARLLVMTVPGGPTPFETVELPPLPLQKWVFVAILRDGRRFDILYNGVVVASHRLAMYPKQVSSPITIGGPTFLGHAQHVIIAPRRLTPSEVAYQQAILSDTTGQPPVKFPLPLPIPFGDLQTLCLPGLPCNPVNAPPSNRMKAWSSIYS